MADEWKETWDWARKTWGDNPDYSFEAFFRGLAQKRAEAEHWEELGSSDVWHACYDSMKRVKAENITTRAQLEQRMHDHMGW